MTKYARASVVRLSDLIRRGLSVRFEVFRARANRVPELVNTPNLKIDSLRYWGVDNCSSISKLFHWAHTLNGLNVSYYVLL